MSVLTLRLAGPLQSWGLSSRFVRRTTAAAPTKSGVIGLLAAALGRGRDADLSDLASLGFGVRIDLAGTRLRDFQTAHHAVTGRAMPLSERFYLADAAFVAAVRGDDALIDQLLDAIRNPYYLPYLGRRSCPPSQPIDLGVRSGSLLEALAAEAWQAPAWHCRRHAREASVELEVLLDAEPADAEGQPRARGSADFEPWQDQPVSFDPRHRVYEMRGVESHFVRVSNPAATTTTRRTPPAPEPAPPSHDPTSLLRGI